jgi:hypothetical protein
VGAQLAVPVGFALDQWRDAETSERVWAPAGPGVYRIENAPVVHVPDQSPTGVSTWDLMLGPLRLSTDAWMPDTFQRARALSIGDHVSGQVTLSLDPTHGGYSPALTIKRIEIRPQNDYEWEQVTRVGSERTRHSEDLQILVACGLTETA